MAPPSWIAVRLSTGYCRLLDASLDDVVTCWRAPDGLHHQLTARKPSGLSSLDKTLRVWDLRRICPPGQRFPGHQDGISAPSAFGARI
ncbi:hypothetical protein HPP92_014752 [Vanilla planifolia]|uniref:Uncharacterized protein n=1 Tax=Vanilla planifolia TaxID=51239 RepID=A0A835QQ44_VANPL|nr:hypothetical protein HPP92_014752 [Vanilla planifolia]